MGKFRGLGHVGSLGYVGDLGHEYVRTIGGLGQLGRVGNQYFHRLQRNLGNERGLGVEQRWCDGGRHRRRQVGAHATRKRRTSSADRLTNRNIHHWIHGPVYVSIASNDSTNGWLIGYNLSYSHNPIIVAPCAALWMCRR